MTTGLITQEELERFKSLRNRVVNIINEVDDGYYKSYEGAMEIDIGFPNVFEAEDEEINKPNWYCITLHSYLFEEFYSESTFAECLDKLEHNVEYWEANVANMMDEERRDEL